MKLIAVTARQVDRDADSLGFLGGRKGLRERYTNGNAFLARLVNLKGAPESIEIYALAALRWGLEGGESLFFQDLENPYYNRILESLPLNDRNTNIHVSRPEY